MKGFSAAGSALVLGIAIGQTCGAATPATAASADTPVAVGTSFQIVPPTHDSIYGGPSVARAADGHFVAAWQQMDPQDSGYGLIHMSVFASDGTPLGPDTVVNTTAQTFGSTLVNVVMDAQGNFLVAWVGESENAIPRGRRFSYDGTAQGADFCLLSGCPGIGWGNNSGVHLLSLDMDDAGDYVAALVTQAGSIPSVLAQRFAADGVPKDPSPFVVTSGPVSSGSRYGFDSVNVSMNRANGDFVVGWHQIVDSGLAFIHQSERDYLQRYRADGSTVGLRTQIAATSFYFIITPPKPPEAGAALSLDTLLMDDAGGIKAVWGQANASQGTVTLYLRRFAPSGFPTGFKTRLTSGSLSLAGGSATHDAAGDAVVIWTDGHSNWGQAIAADGSLQGSPFEIVVGDFTYPISASMDDSGGFTVAWGNWDSTTLEFSIVGQDYAP